MFTLLSSLLGFGTSFIPKILDFFKERRDQAHSLEVIKAQTQRDIALHKNNVEITNLEADVKKETAVIDHDKAIGEGASTWMINLRASVRPVITYLFFGVFLLVEGTAVYVGVQQGGDWVTVVPSIWTEEIHYLFSVVISFWFGSRIVQSTKFLNRK